MRSLLAIIALVFSSTAAAVPTGTFGADCANGGCHDNTTTGRSISITDPIEIAIGESALVHFLVEIDTTADPGTAFTDGAIKLAGMDAAGLGATFLNTDDWTDQSTLNYWYSTVFGGSQGTTWPLELSIPGDATVGTYAIDMILAGSANPGESTGRWSFTSSFQINVVPVPVTPAVWLFGSGLLGLIGISRRKKSR